VHDQQDLHIVRTFAVGDDVRVTGDDQFAGFRETARTADTGMVDQLVGFLLDSSDYAPCRCGVPLGQVVSLNSVRGWIVKAIQ
jgi:hypothetical protein